MTDIRHFLDLDKMSAETLSDILDLGSVEKAGKAPFGDKPLAGKTLALIFEKPSTRTRVSFEVGMRQLGGDVVTLDAESSQIGRGESIADTARVLSRFVDAIMIRTTDESKLLELAQYATVPVINGLTDQSHPCQIMADLMTIKEHKGRLDGLKFAWVGDGNNVSTSFIHAAPKFGFALDLACPVGYRPNQGLIETANAEGGKVRLTDMDSALDGADVIVTDCWVSMGDKDADARMEALTPYQINASTMAKAKPDAIFMHCLPAHRNEEVTDEVIDGPQSVVFDEAENRLHAQKGVLLYCFNGLPS
ncbi:ornithine carbamoyltransferase [Thalassospira alkalitolerans]|uniref:Ornithine carbamoyltransferase n=1 Tax=Thalassospira alkalitolerans TaxID=1293890 RepID=A0A1Y2LGP4_9PROT|nr:ornithine carbamoyltransferase [Thalassospira alkalitolerans]OSQ50331.1 ornithine carbamoyltransferase [Thalassospira alkalitolerans]|tara:strand:- start:11847 stop:12764 length:918 start_codon:yes stop_codon:yes gene_type:complete